ncbi:M1 family metallopeptidase [Streptomyces cinnamoneus]|uniref:Aminopeptidase N n=1 Tax=Streptomyces cinnamoneus TaxID=53446 RepID=A0A918WID4_STRCJ|nr:M1 family metallopeptidase [Streptomyces cinnamoneus]GHC49134.1 peptidase [Streptomyces cinnamoneus]
MALSRPTRHHSIRRTRQRVVRRARQHLIRPARRRLLHPARCRPGRWFLALATAAASVFVLVSSPVTAPAATLPAPGAAGIGDPYFPGLGNGGFDVRHYDLDVGYAPDTGRLDGRATLTARTTRSLSAFNLDLQQLKVTSVEVNGLPAAFTREGGELRIHPVIPLPQGRTFTTTVVYGGVPRPLSGPIVFGSKYGWMKTKDGVFVGCEPNGASTWFPASDHPTDKATFDIRIRAPRGLTAVSNGRLLATHERGRTTVAHWRESKPMAPYLATATIGKFDVKKGTTPGGIPVYVATDPALAGGLDFYGITAEATDHWSKVFGPYPFEETGAVVDDMPEAEFSLETQTKPVFSAVRDESTVVHELAHQWFGDSVSVRQWKDIWLNEGFATYAEWLWDEHKGRRTTHQSFLAAYQEHKPDDPFWKINIADPQRDTMFSRAVYFRGAMTLQVLRERIGDRAFFRLLPLWTKLHRHGNVRTSQFTGLAEAVSRKDLGDLFATWLSRPGRPPLPAPGGGARR